MSIKVQGFPVGVSDEIILPDVAELLTMPIFFDTDIDDAYKHGTDFQRKLIDMTPLRGNKNTISVLSQIRMLGPSLRSCTTYVSDDTFQEFHIDCEENEDGKHVFHEERDIVHLLSNDVSSLTEFNANEFIINELDENSSYSDFQIELQKYRHLVVPKKMPANRIVTFTNHLHRAVDPTKIEFRYMFRVVETDRQRKPSKYSNSITRVANAMNEYEDHIVQYDNKVSIYVPRNLRNLPQVKNNFPEENIVGQDDANKFFDDVKFDEVIWSNDSAEFNIDVLGENSIVFIKKIDKRDLSLEQSFNDYLSEPYNKIKMFEYQNANNHFTLHSGSGGTYNLEGYGRCLCLYFRIPKSEVQYVKSIQYGFESIILNDNKVIKDLSLKVK